MIRFCEQEDGSFDCRTWDACTHRGICLAQLHALAPLNKIADAVLGYRPKNKAKNLRPKKRKKAK